MHRLMIVAVLALGLALLPDAPPAAAQTCPPPGGVDLGWAQPERAGEFHVLGRGWGHGVGMSQHGAQGAAKFGCNVAQILGTYYPGTTIGTGADRDIRVGLFTKSGESELPNVINVDAVEGSIPWRYTHPNGNVTFEATQPEGERWTAQVSSNGRLSLHRGDDEMWTAEEVFGHLEAVVGNGNRKVALPSKGGRRYRFGTLRFRPDGSTGRMFVTINIASIERYLYGLAEMPSSWEAVALQAQAVTGRSYAQVRRGVQGSDTCDCHLVDSPANQVYVGYEKEGGPDGHHWRAAVDATKGQVLTYEGNTVSGFYSSSHGGHSEQLTFSSFFNTPTNPGYLRPVDDSRWESNAPSAVTRWTETYSRAQLTQAFAHLGVGAVQSVHVRQPLGAAGRVGNPDRVNSAGQRYGGVEVIGTSERRLMSGLAFIRALEAGPGLARRSELFRVQTGVGCLPTASQADNEVVTRSAGQHRVATAAAVSADHWDAAADVVLATSITFPDALSAGALAARLDAPVLLTRGSALDPEPRAELQRLGAERVHLMGGTAALSDAVEQALVADGYEVRRVAGPGRFDTARAAALAAGPSETGEVALAFGGDWPDAVSAGALSGGPDRVPTLLSERDTVPDVTMRALEDLGAERVLLIGGSAVLTGAGVGDQLRAAGYDVARLSGPSRYSTSVAVASDAAGRADGDRPVVLATGQEFPDALAAGGLTARLSAALVLTARCDLGSIPETLEHLERGPYDEGVVVGGTAAVSDLVREQATGAVTR